MLSTIPRYLRTVSKQVGDHLDDCHAFEHLVQPVLDEKKATDPLWLRKTGYYIRAHLIELHGPDVLSKNFHDMWVMVKTPPLSDFMTLKDETFLTSLEKLKKNPNKLVFVQQRLRKIKKKSCLEEHFVKIPLFRPALMDILNHTQLPRKKRIGKLKQVENQNQTQQNQKSTIDDNSDDV
jgi:hypothetical protein